MRVLHVTECYAGGVRRAIDTLVSTLPEFEHLLLWCGDERPNAHGLFTEEQPLPSGAFSRTLTVMKYVDSTSPNVVHAHSSWAGLYTRIAKLRVPVIYQPHCYAFTDIGRGLIARRSFQFVEQVLARRTHATIALSAEEERIARTLAPNGRVVRVNNVASIRPSTSDIQTPDRSSVPLVAMSGRICAQKDPVFFMETMRFVKSRVPEVQFCWIGDGDIDTRSFMVGEGVEVTGWLGHECLESRLASVDVYLHTAAYEGFPLSVLDAAAFSIPIVVRDIPAFGDTSLIKARTPSNAADRIVDILMNPTWQDAAVNASRSLDERSSSSLLAQTMTSVYHEVIEQ